MVSRFDAKSKYQAVAQAVCEVLWASQLLEEVGFKNLLPAKLWCDNQIAIHIASNRGKGYVAAKETNS